MFTTKIAPLAALIVLLAFGSSTAQPAGGPAAKPTGKATAATGKAPAPKMTKQQERQQAKQAARQAKIDAKKAEKQAAKGAQKQARVAERKPAAAGKAAEGLPHRPGTVPGLAEKTGRGAQPAAPANKAGAERGLDRAAARSSDQGTEGRRAHGGSDASRPGAKAKPPKGKAAD